MLAQQEFKAQATIQPQACGCVLVHAENFPLFGSAFPLRLPRGCKNAAKLV